MRNPKSVRIVHQMRPFENGSFVASYVRSTEIFALHRFADRRVFDVFRALIRNRPNESNFLLSSLNLHR